MINSVDGNTPPMEELITYAQLHFISSHSQSYLLVVLNLCPKQVSLRLNHHASTTFQGHKANIIIRHKLSRRNQYTASLCKIYHYTRLDCISQSQQVSLLLKTEQLSLFKAHWQMASLNGIEILCPSCQTVIYSDANAP